MRDNDDLQHAADRLDALWDDLINTDDASTHSGDDAASAALVAYLNLLAPSIDSPARERIRARLFHDATGGQPVTAQPDQIATTRIVSAPGAMPSRFPDRRPWRDRLNHPIVQIAATILLVLAFAASWMVFDRGNGPVHRGSHMAAIASPSPDQGMPYGTGRAEGVLTVELDRASTDRDLVATIRRITLPPGAEWIFDTGQFGLQSNLVSHHLESGTVTLIGPDTEMPIATGEAFDFNRPANSGAVTTIRNTGNEPAVLFQMIVHESRDSNSLPAPPQGAPMQIMGNIPVHVPAMQRTRLLVARSTLFGGTFRPAGEPGRDILFAHLESGEMRVTSGLSSNGAPVQISQINGGDSTSAPADGATLQAGASVTTPSGALPALDAIGDQPTTALLLTVAPISDAELANRGVSSTWTVPANGAVTLELRKITLAPGEQLTMDLPDIALYWGIAGIANLSIDGNPSGTIAAGQLLEQSGSGTITLQNDEAEPAVLIQAVASSAPVALDAAQIEVIAQQSFTLPAGTAIVAFRIENPGAGGSGYLNQSAELLAVLSGNASMQRIGGDVDLHLSGQISAPGSQPAIGTTVPLTEGDWFAVAPGGAYRLSAESGSDAQVLSLSTGMTELDAAATPVATPAASGQGEVIPVASGDCRITPRTLDAFAAILADPYADGTPTAGKRDLAGSGTPADQATIDGVLDTIKQVVACNAPGSHLSLYSLYSANMLRYGALHSSLTIYEIESMAAMTPQTDESPVAGYVSIENVVIFPDGRAGAMANVNGEFAYLTFIYEDGFWQIDFWDDRANTATPIP